MYKNKRIGAIVLARMHSTRLPGKVMLSLRGKPVLQQIVERLRNSNFLDDVIIATANNGSCDPIVEMCTRLNYSYFVGSEEDIAARCAGAANFHNLDIVVRITGDCPMVDWQIVDTLIEAFFTYECDYCSNVIERTFPRGLDVEVFSREVLDEIDRLAEGVDRQHITTYIYRTHPERYKRANMSAEGLLHRPDLRITLDTLEDYQVLHALFERLLPGFTAEQAVYLLNHLPQLREINQGVEQKHVQAG